MYTFGNFKHELDYILLNGYYNNIFTKHSLINGRNNYFSKVKEINSKTVQKVNKPKFRKVVNYFGINNFENCCFLNATLQVILNCTQFISALKQYEIRSHGNSVVIETLLSYFSQVHSSVLDFQILHSENSIIYCGSKIPIINPCLDLIPLLGFKKNQHEDAEEFLTKLLTQIHEDLMTCQFINIPTDENNEEDDQWVEIGKGGKTMSPPREDGGEMSTETILSELISGKMIEKITKRNRTCNVTATPFFILPLNIQHNDIVDVTTALSNLTLSEKLTDSFERRMQIGHLPDLLMLQLKRFTFSKDNGIEKISKKIAINPVLTIPLNCLSSDQQQADYQLHAVVFHIGEGVYKGHYTAAVRDGESWVYIDDINVFLVSGPAAIEWLLHSSSADIPSNLLSLGLCESAPRSACMSGPRSPYLIVYSRIPEPI